MKFSLKKKGRSHLLRKPLMEIFIFYAVSHSIADNYTNYIVNVMFI